MPLVFSAITPHPPQLLNNQDKPPAELSNTYTAFQLLAGYLYSAKPDLLLVITPHGEILPSAWQLLIDDKLHGDLKNFSDFSTDLEINGSIGFSHRLKERAEDHRFQIVLRSGRQLDYASVIPLYFLINHLKSIRIASLIVSGEDVPAHYEIGKLLREEIFSTNERVAVIVSANLSHRLSKDSPGGFSPQGQVFDNKIITALKKGLSEDIISISPDLAEEAMTCSLRPIAILLGALHRKKYHTEILGYEYPHGVGYCTALLTSH
ncbi:MAG: class III extradiol dioxygenase subunit B-like domain-containing protein [bacterium]